MTFKADDCSTVMDQAPARISDDAPPEVLTADLINAMLDAGAGISDLVL